MLGITVRQALELPELAVLQVVGGHRGLDRVIKSVNIMETPDISRFVAPGELLLTTTFPIYNDPHAMQELIPSLDKCGVTALVIKLARYIDSVPEEMVRQADELGFPLLSVPGHVPFNSLLNPVLTEILQRQAALLKRSEEVHRRLTDVVLKGEGLAAVAQTLAGLLGLPVLITDHQFHTLVRSYQDDTAEEELAAFVDRMCQDEIYPSGGSPIHRSIWIDSRRSTVLIHPVRIGEDVVGYLCVWEKDGELKDRDTICVEQGALVAALEIQHRQAVQETERRYYNEFLRHLLAGRVTSREEALARGQVYGWDLSQGRVVLLFRLVGSNGTEIPVECKLRCEKRIEKAVYYGLPESSRSHILTHLGDTTILLMAPPRLDADLAKEEALRVAQRVLRELEPDSKPMGYALHIGVSRLQEDVMQWDKAYRQAKEAVQIQMQLTEGCSATHFDDLGIYRLIARITDLDELEQFCIEQLGALIEYDAKNGSDLIGTLKAVIEADGNLQRASEMLFIHYNTLRYRVRRIEEIQGAKTDSWGRMSSVDIALKGYHVLQAKKARR